MLERQQSGMSMSASIGEVISLGYASDPGRRQPTADLTPNEKRRRAGCQLRATAASQEPQQADRVFAELHDIAAGEACAVETFAGRPVQDVLS